MALHKVNGGLGFSITGGCDYELNEGDPSVYITAIVPDGAAEKVRRWRGMERGKGVEGRREQEQRRRRSKKGSSSEVGQAVS